MPTPGLPEVCKGCSGALQVESNRDQKTSATKSEGLVDRFPTLSGEKPRIVLLASGGVFRGPFHAGMLACLLSAQIRPQMIVGASVGTLMGGALGALLTVAEYKQAVALLGNIVDVFLHVDERIAFTKPFKSAMRELGIRGRSIRLSPAQLRKRVLRGSRADASFAATGAPAPLIDAIADLAMIPLEETSKIAAEFVSGHVAAAANLLLQQLKVETLQRLDITTAIIGTSLLEPTARTLLGEHMGIELGRQQPFRNIAFFATTSDIRAARSIILGTHAIANGNSYDFVQAALASSAFPCIFSPRRESDIRPGVGNPDSLFSDGGMFDNLPYIPAITVLAGVQREYRKAHALDSVQYLRSRSSSPDLFIVGSLDIRAEIDESRNGPFNNLVAITKRAKLLQNNMKIGAFESSAERIHKQLGLLLGRAGGYQTPSDVQFVDGIVDAATLAVFPSDADHLNPTFAFCRSTGFKPWRVRLSIADGCFQTFAKLVDAAGQPSGSVLGDAMRGLMSDRIPMIERRPTDGNYQRGECPFFRHSADTSASHKAGKLVSAGQNGTQAFKCPFYEAWETLSRDDQKHSAESAGSSLGVYHECISDSIHRRAQ
ncbi:MAG: hypothetical protein DMG60_22355 [Acidobacteria bacterium]|nr:MAG: hypothetical protein DMG60_22355 [Acidobacteriota bacterium]